MLSGLSLSRRPAFGDTGQWSLDDSTVCSHILLEQQEFTDFCVRVWYSGQSVVVVELTGGWLVSKQRCDQNIRKILDRLTEPCTRWCRCTYTVLTWTLADSRTAGHTTILSPPELIAASPCTEPIGGAATKCKPVGAHPQKDSWRLVGSNLYHQKRSFVHDMIDES